MAGSEIKAQETVDKPTGEAHGNVTATQVGTKYAMDVAVVGGSTVGPSGEPIVWDTITRTAPGTDSELYTYTSGTDTVLTVTVTYTDATLETISTVVKATP